MVVLYLRFLYTQEFLSLEFFLCVIDIKYLPKMYLSEVSAFLWIYKELGIQWSKNAVR